MLISLSCKAMEDERFPTFAVNLKKFPFWVCSCLNEYCSKMVSQFFSKPSYQKHPLKKFTFLGIGNVILSEMGLGQGGYVPCVSLAIQSFFAKRRLNRGKQHYVYPWQGVSVKLLSNDLCSQVVFETIQKSPSSSFRNMTVLAVFDAIDFLHSLIVSSISVKHKDSRIARMYNTRTLISLCAELVFGGGQCSLKEPACAVCPLRLHGTCGTMSIELSFSYYQNAQKDSAPCSKWRFSVTWIQ